MPTLLSASFRAAFSRGYVMFLLVSAGALGVVTSILHAPVRAVGDAYGSNFDGRVYDVNFFSTAGSALLRGDLAAVYENKFNQAGPLQVVADALIVDAVQPVPFPWSWYLVQAVVCAAILFASGFLTRILIASVDAPKIGECVPSSVEHVVRRWAPVAVMMLLTIWNLPVMTYLSGHWWQLLVVATWISAGVLMRGQHPVWAGVLVAFGVAWEPWAVFGGVFVVWAPRWRDAFKFVAVSVAGALMIWVPFIVQPGFALTDYEWEVRTDSGWAWIVEPSSPFPWTSRIAQTLLVGVVVVGAAFLARRSISHLPRDVWWWAVWVCSVVVSARVTTDVWFGQYYITPVILGVLALMCAALYRGRFLVSGLLLLASAGFFIGSATAGPFFGALLSLLGLLAAGAMQHRNLVRADRQPVEVVPVP